MVNVEFGCFCSRIHSGSELLGRSCLVVNTHRPPLSPCNSLVLNPKPSGVRTFGPRIHSRSTRWNAALGTPCKSRCRGSTAWTMRAASLWKHKDCCSDLQPSWRKTTWFLVKSFGENVLLANQAVLWFLKGHQQENRTHFCEFPSA